MTLPGPIKVALYVLLLAVVGAGLAGCGRSKGQPNSSGPQAGATPAVIVVSTTPAVVRQLPRYFEASGSLAPNEQTDVAAETSGKVVAVGLYTARSPRPRPTTAQLHHPHSPPTSPHNPRPPHR